MSAALHLLHAQLRPSVGPLDAPVSWWARISARHRAKVLPRETTSGTSSSAQPAMALSQQQRRFVPVLGQVHVSHRFLGQPCPEHLIGGIAHPQAQQHALVTSLVQSFVAREQQLADAIQRVTLASSMAQRLVLHPASHVVQTAVPRLPRGTGRPPGERGRDGATVRPGTTRPGRWPPPRCHPATRGRPWPFIYAGQRPGCPGPCR